MEWIRGISPTKKAIVSFAALLAVAAALIIALMHPYTEEQQPYAEYVALGSSFAAGPGVHGEAANSPTLCMQSNSNYGRILAALEVVSFHDASCSGATTRDVLSRDSLLRLPQIAALRRQTKLVTVTVGGNDVGYIGNLVAEACRNDPKAVPFAARVLGFCRAMPAAQVEAGFRDLPQQLHRILQGIHQAAPDARVIIVDYTTVLPGAGTCPRLHLTPEEADAGREVARRLVELTAEAAARDRVELLEASVLSRGHDVCSDDPWINGFVFPAKVSSFGPAAFHPNAKAMEAIAAALAQRLRADPPTFVWRPSISDDQHFVERRQNRLALNSRPYRFGEINIEWLGLEDYGPQGKRPPHVPTAFEVEDALATAEEMGARVVRSQTLGDTIGCAACLEPRPGSFSEAMLRHIDEVIAAASRHHLRLIIPFTGDCAACQLNGFPVNTGMNQYLQWFGGTTQEEFYTNRVIVTDYQARVTTLLNRVNTKTGIAYKNDPTIFAWENCNLCSVESHIVDGKRFVRTLNPKSIEAAVHWVDVIGKAVKAIDRHHLYLDNSGFYRDSAEVLDLDTVDVVSYEYYPHWSLLTHLRVTPGLISKDAAEIVAHGKVDMPVEIGWDRTNWFLERTLQRTLSRLESNPNVSGDGFWALMAHSPEGGWQDIPADAQGWLNMLVGESGEWWALYYSGRETRINSKGDMARRAQMLRSHFYAMQGREVPVHAIPPAPEISDPGSRHFQWRGSAGAVAYSLEWAPVAGGPWDLVCEACLSDTSENYATLSKFKGKWIRILAVNADGIAGEPSAPAFLN